MRSQTLTLLDGRRLGYAIEGEGKPVIYFHGTASSRLEILLLKEFSHENRFQLIGIDRPGYGLSTFSNTLRLRDFASDVDLIADHLDLNRFAVLSWSGGGPFALTYTAIYPERITQAVTVGSPALPFDASEAHNSNLLAKTAIKNTLLSRFALSFFRRSVLKANQNIEGYLKSHSGKNMVADWPKPDRKFFSNPTWLKLLYTAMAEGFRQKNSVETVLQEHHLFLKPWSENLGQIPTGKLKVWQGTQDKTCPVNNSNKIAQAAKDANVKLFPHEGHCVLFAQTQQLSSDLST